MKSSGMVAPLLAGSVAARAMLDARALVGVDTSGAVCPAARADTVLVQPIFYSEFIPYNTVIDPFRNGRPVTINNAPTPIITISDFRTTILGGSVTLPGTNTVSPTPGSSTTQSGASATSTTPGASGSATGTGSVSGSITGTPTAATGSTTTTTTTTPGAVAPGLSLADSGINGVVQNFPFLVLAFSSTGATKRDLPHLKRQNTDPVNVVDLNGNSNNAFAEPPAMCDSASPLALVNGVLTNGNEVVAKLQQQTEAAIGFLNPAVPGSVNGTFTVVDGILNWSPTDGLPSATFYSCPDGLWAGFPAVGATRLAQCVRVTAGAIAGSKCQQYIESTQNRRVRGDFDQPSGSLIPESSTTTTTTTSATGIVPTTAVTTTTSEIVPVPTTTSILNGGAVI